MLIYKHASSSSIHYHYIHSRCIFYATSIPPNATKKIHRLTLNQNYSSSSPYVSLSMANPYSPTTTNVHTDARILATQPGLPNYINNFSGLVYSILQSICQSPPSEVFSTTSLLFLGQQVCFFDPIWATLKLGLFKGFLYFLLIKVLGFFYNQFLLAS